MSGLAGECTRRRYVNLLGLSWTTFADADYMRNQVPYSRPLVRPQAGAWRTGNAHLLVFTCRQHRGPLSSNSGRRTMDSGQICFLNDCFNVFGSAVKCPSMDTGYLWPCTMHGRDRKINCIYQTILVILCAFNFEKQSVANSSCNVLACKCHA